MYSKLLVPVDGSETSNAGLMEGVRLAKIQGSQICLVHIVNELLMDSTYAAGAINEDVFDAMRKGGKQILDAAEQWVIAEGIRPTCVLVESIGGVAAQLILEQAANWHADVIVMGTHGRHGIFRLAMGSDAEQVVRGASIPVMLVRGQQRQRLSRNNHMYANVLVPIDGSDTSSRGLQEAISMAKGQSSHLRLFHLVAEHVLDTAYCIGTYEGEVAETHRKTAQEVMKASEALVLRKELEFDSVVEEFGRRSAAEAIIQQATSWPADLIVMGTHGRRGISRLALGSDAESVVRGALAPVLLVRAPL